MSRRSNFTNHRNIPQHYNPSANDPYDRHDSNDEYNIEEGDYEEDEVVFVEEEGNELLLWSTGNNIDSSNNLLKQSSTTQFSQNNSQQQNKRRSIGHAHQARNKRRRRVGLDLLLTHPDDNDTGIRQDSDNDDDMVDEDEKEENDSEDIFASVSSLVDRSNETRTISDDAVHSLEENPSTNPIHLLSSSPAFRPEPDFPTASQEMSPAEDDGGDDGEQQPTRNQHFNVDFEIGLSQKKKNDETKIRKKKKQKASNEDVFEIIDSRASTVLDKARRIRQRPTQQDGINNAYLNQQEQHQIQQHRRDESGKLDHPELSRFDRKHSIKRRKAPIATRNRDSGSTAKEADKSKSIVGSRPSHWKAPISINRQKTPRMKPHASNPMKTALSEATKRRILPRKNHNPNEVNEKRQKALSMAASSSSSSSLLSARKNPTLMRTSIGRIESPHLSQNGNTNDTQKWEPNVDIRSMNFGPSFKGVCHEEEMHSCENSKDEISDIQVGINDSLLVLTPRTVEKASSNHEKNLQNMSQFSNPLTPLSQVRGGRERFGGNDLNSMNGSSSSRKKAGPLMRELRNIRGKVEGDWARLNSGNYPHTSPCRRNDVNDPRNRAEHYIDVTVVSESPLEWQSGGRATVLGYVHNLVFTDKKSLRSANRSGAMVSLSPPHNNQCSFDINEEIWNQPHFAWICFTFETLREQNVQNGTQLRIYDSISVPTRRRHQNNVQYGGEQSQPRDNIYENISTLLCTRVCERYPSVLPPLPNIPSHEH